MVLVVGLVVSGCANPGVKLTPVLTSPTIVTKAPAIEVLPMMRSIPVRIRIPAIRVTSGLIPLGLKSDGSLATPDNGVTAGWYTGAPTPGEVGPAVIVAHVHWGGIAGVFFRLSDLKPGDKVLVTRTDRRTATFTVVRVASFPKAHFPSALVYGNIGFAGLRLVTCGGFDPIARAYEANIVVFARLSAG
jgi:sortase (surface protein transpeptidase)